MDKSKENPVRFRGDVALSLGYSPKFRQKDQSSHFGELKINAFTLSDILAAATINYDFIFPVLVTANKLTKLNNLSLKNQFRLSPSHMEGTMELNFTPIALYNIGVGAGLGTGWIIPGMSNTLAVNNNGILSQQSFLGPVFSFYLTQAVSMDFSLLFPERFQKWTHIILRISNSFTYRKMIGTDDNTPWVWGDDEGTNLNGWLLYLQFLLAYRIPLIEDRRQILDPVLSHKNRNTSILIGAMLEINNLNLSHYYDSPMGSSGWGSDFVPLLISPMCRIELPRDLYINILVQFCNYPVYTNSSYNSEIFYQNRTYSGWFFYSKRFIINLGWKF